MAVLAGLWGRLPRAAGYQAGNIRHRLQLCTGIFYSTQPPSSDVTVQYNHGLPVITLTLPSRNERCNFTIKPMTTTVGQFFRDIQKEDQGIDKLAVISTDGTKFSSSTLMNVLLKNDFQLVINKSTHYIRPPPTENLQADCSEQLDPLKCMIQDLHTVFYYDEYLLHKEQQFLQRLESLKEELQPLEEDYVYPEVSDRQFLHAFHRKAKGKKFDIEKYNKLRNDLAETEESLRRLRNPLQLKLPIEQLHAQE
ncbi:calcium uniporter regulatory subunit MCUb, mitochondrial isoform X2 [Eleutherodactylus coqui]|uniref:calcium uniporter regulatory subunit MCUb, mitochondrial isoform X2 n=1 Tax=Eleutherodactylus coqui TaxID=57060 RepID=UPI003461C261